MLTGNVLQLCSVLMVCVGSCFQWIPFLAVLKMNLIWQDYIHLWLHLDDSMKDCCAKGSCVSLWIPLIPQTKPSIKRRPDSGVGFSLMPLTILNPPLSPLKNTLHPVLHPGLPSPLSPLMPRTFITWADGTSIKRRSASKMANTFLTQDLMRLSWEKLKQ